MEIKEQTQHRMVIAPATTERLLGIVFVIFGFFWVLLGFLGGVHTELTLMLISDILFGLIGILFFLFGLGKLIGSKKVVIDKLTGDITVNRRYLLLINRQRIIPLSTVSSIDFNKKVIWFFNIPALLENLYLILKIRFSRFGFVDSFSYDAWLVSFNIGDEKVKIDHSVDRGNSHYLANEISNLTGKKLVVNLPKTQSSFKGSENTEFDYPSKRPPSYPI